MLLQKCVVDWTVFLGSTFPLNVEWLSVFVFCIPPQWHDRHEAEFRNQIQIFILYVNMGLGRATTESELEYQISVSKQPRYTEEVISKWCDAFCSPRKCGEFIKSGTQY